MENRIEFKLEKALNKWRVDLKKSLQFTEGNLLELESHILDEIERLQTLGLTGEEAFVLALHQMGSNKELITEFGKVNKKLNFINRMAPYLQGMVLYAIFALFIRITSHNYSVIAQYFDFKDSTVLYMFLTFLGFVSLGIIGTFYTIYKSSNSRYKKIFSVPYLILFGVLLTALSFVFNFYMMDLLLDKYNVVSSHPQLNMSSWYFVLGINLCLLITLGWSYFVKKQENKMQLSN